MNTEVKHYRCHKEVHARPMTRGEYNEYRDWQIPVNENPADEGYLVIYNRDTPDHYESWSPKKQFDDGYAEIKVLTDDEIEAEIQAKGLTAPRVTPDQIEELMSKCQVICQQVPGTTTTVATVVDSNGFTICSEISACASPENFDKELGEKIATNRALAVARDELWRLEGYRLKRSLAEAAEEEHY